MSADRTLSELFHSALDAEDVAGPFQRLQLELDKSTGAALRRRTRRIFMTRQRIALLAAALVIVLIAGVLVSTRIYTSQLRDTSVPAGTPSPQIDHAAVNQLLARPLHFQTLNPGDSCPDSSDSFGFLGQGPAYGDVNGLASTTTWGTYWSVAILTPPNLAGPVVVRSRDLAHGTPVLDIGPLGAGPVFATDVYEGASVKQFQAVALDTDHVTKGDYPVNGTDYKRWSYLQGFKKAWGGGCIGVQIDGPGFTENFYNDVPTN